MQGSDGTGRGRGCGYLLINKRVDGGKVRLRMSKGSYIDLRIVE